MSFEYDFGRHRVIDPANVPTDPHWIIIRYVSVDVDTGWGPSSNVLAEHFVFVDRATWVAAIQSLMTVQPYRAPEKFVAYEAPKLARITTNIDVRGG